MYSSYYMPSTTNLVVAKTWLKRMKWIQFISFSSAFLIAKKIYIRKTQCESQLPTFVDLIKIQHRSRLNGEGGLELQK